MRERGNLRDPFVTRGTLRRLGLLKREQVVNVDASLIAYIELKQELFDVERQESLIDHEVELLGSDFSLKLLISLALLKQKLLDNLGQVFGRGVG